MNVFDLFAKLSLDTSEYEKGLKGAKKEADSFGSKVLGGLGNVGKATAKATVAAVGAAATGIAALTKEAVSNYAEYEQLVGGMETLFKESSGKIQQYAADAYKTAGMSANDYMELTTSFAATLLQGLNGDTAAAANAANKAIIDMSDNVNKMGTSMESVQNAYRGFAKNNYTMLDNLSLGYGGTADEMARLINDSKVLGDAITVTSKTVKDVPFDKVIEAIHIIQQQMGITGTTSKEAAETISGSMASVQAAWQNLVTGFANKDADIGQLIQNLIEPATNVLNNMLPVVEQALTGIGTFIEQALPVIMDRLPNLINELLPKLIDSAVNAVKVIVGAIFDNAPLVGQSAADIVLQLVNGITSALPNIVVAALEIILALADGIADALPELIPAVVQAILTITQTLLVYLPYIQQAAIDILMALSLGLIDALPILMDAAPEIIHYFVDALIQVIPNVLIASIAIMSTLAAGILENLPRFIVKTIPAILRAIVDGLVEGVADIKRVGINLINGLWEGMSGRSGWLYDKVASFLEKFLNHIKNILGVHSPSTIMAGIGGFMVEGLENGWADNIDRVKDMINSDLAFSPAQITASVNTTSRGSTLPTGGMTGASSSNDGNIIIPIYLGGESLDTIIVNANRRIAYRSGGMEYA